MSVEAEVEMAWRLVLGSSHLYKRGFESGVGVGESAAFEPKLIIFLGMGGSGIVGDIVSDMMYPIHRHPTYVCKDYTLPVPVDDKTLVIVLSYSGNTAETLTGAAEAYTSGGRLFAITSGGLLDDLAGRHGIPTVKVAKGMEPRFAVPEMVGALIGVLHGLGIAGKLERLFLTAVESLTEYLRGFEKTAEGEPQRISKTLLGRVAVAVGHTHLRSVSYRLKSQLNENAKHPSYVTQLPEAFHNEMESWRPSQHTSYIIFRSSYEPPAISAALNWIVGELESSGQSYSVIRTQSKTYVDEMLKLITLSDLISISLAAAKGVHPLKLSLIPSFRRLLSLDGRLQDLAVRRFGG